MNQSKIIPCKSKDYQNKNPPGFVNWKSLVKQWSLQEKGTMGWEAARSWVPNKPHADRSAQPNLFLKPEGGIAIQDRWHSGIARGSFSPYPQGGPKARNHLLKHLDVVRLLLLWMQLTGPSRLDFGWVFALYLPERLRQGDFFPRQRTNLIKVLHSDRSDCIFVWRSRNRLRLVQICYKRCFGLSTSVQRSRRDMVGQWFTFETSIPGSSFLWLRGNCCFPDKVVHGDSM